MLCMAAVAEARQGLGWQWHQLLFLCPSKWVFGISALAAGILGVAFQVLIGLLAKGAGAAQTSAGVCRSWKLEALFVSSWPEPPRNTSGRKELPIFIFVCQFNKKKEERKSS